MRSRHTPCTYGAARSLGLALAAAVLFLMPVTYRGGADEAHPHAMLQLWFEALHGVPDHQHAHLRHGRHRDTTASETTRVAPDIPRSQESALVAVSPVPMLPPLAGITVETRRHAGPVPNDPATPDDVLLRPEPPPPRVTASTHPY